MNATNPKNRAAAYYDSPDLKGKSSTPPVVLPEPQPVPVGPIAKREAFSDALFEAIQLYRTHLKHPDPKIADRAAHAIMNLQLALLRHGKELEGTRLPAQVTPHEPEDSMIDLRYGDGPDAEDEEDVDEGKLDMRLGHIEYVQRGMQREADLRGLGEYIDWYQAQFAFDHPGLPCPGFAPNPHPPVPRPRRE